LEWDCPFGRERKSPAAAGVCRINKKARETSPARKSGAGFRREFLRLRDQAFDLKLFSSISSTTCVAHHHSMELRAIVAHFKKFVKKKMHQMKNIF
jgi:hypothetical protein